MTEHDLKAFTKVVTRYFEDVTGVAAHIGMPFIKGERQVAFDYTGVIGVSGSRKGAVYLTAGEELLRAFGAHILGDDELDEDSLFDLVGEMTNTIAGNMRGDFGSTFLISVPIIMKGKIDDITIRLKPPVFIIPITWKGFVSRFAIGLE